MKPSENCTKLIQQFQGCTVRLPNGSFRSYPDPGTGGDPWTIGWGTTGSDIHRGLVWTQQQCDERFARDLDAFAVKITTVLGAAATTQDQFDAMLSFAYNIGLPNFASSSLVKKHKAGDYEGAAAGFAKWIKAGGKVMAGLTRRRAAEAKLYAG